MYEKNAEPLPAGDFTQVFHDQLASIYRTSGHVPPPRLSPDNVLRWAHREIQPELATICRRLMLPGSRVVGVEHLADLARLADTGSACIVCLNHRSNLDVPNLFTLLADQGQSELFDRLIWIAGRKLEEDDGSTPVLVQAFNRVVVSPPTWLNEQRTAAQLHEAGQINLAAHREIHDLKHRGWVFALFPTATRMRPGDESTARAIDETDSYLKHFDYLLLGRIDGCTLPVSRDHDLTHETPVVDQVQYTFGSLVSTSQWRSAAVARFPHLDQRAATAEAIIDDIAAVAPHHSANASDARRS